MFGPTKIKEEAIVPAETLYQTALADMDQQRYNTAIDDLKKLERQHPYSEYNEKAKLMEVYANYRIGKFDDAILAADRYIALFPSSDQTPYVLFLKGTAYFAQITDITRDQQHLAERHRDLHAADHQLSQERLRQGRARQDGDRRRPARGQGNVGRPLLRGQRPVRGGDQPLPHRGR